MKKPPIPPPLSIYIIECCNQYGTLLRCRYAYGDLSTFGSYVAECAYAFESDVIILSEIVNGVPVTIQKFVK